MGFVDPKIDRPDPVRSGGALLRAAQRLQPWADQIALAVAFGKPGCDLDILLVKDGARSTSLQVRTAVHSGFLKLFHRNDAAAVAGYRRERDALALLKGAPGVPRHLAQCDDELFVLTEFVDGQSLSRAMNPANAPALTFDLGVWLARYEADAPARPTHGNWFTYLSRFGRGLDQTALTRASDALCAIPLCGQVLARGDAALSNFILGDAGQLVGCDYERAQFRPRGFDLLMTFQVLVQRFPAQGVELLDALAAGFGSQHRGALIAEELKQVARILFCATADTKKAA